MYMIQQAAKRPLDLDEFSAYRDLIIDRFTDSSAR